MFREMRYVYEVYRERSFSKAAQKLYISQPSLSAMVKRAEGRVGSPIFDRSTSPIGLTEAGREYIRSAQQVMEIEDRFARYLSDASQCLTGSLAVGGTTLFTSYVLPPMISSFSARYPAVEIQIHETHTVALEKELADGTLDLIAENYAFDPEIYGREPFRSERLLLAAPGSMGERAEAYRLSAAQVRSGDHLLRETPTLPLALFENQPFLLLKEGNDTRLRADRLFARCKIRPNARLLLDQQITAYNLACYGMGAAFISDTLVMNVPPADNLCFFKLDEDLAQREICLYYKKNRFLTSVIQAFISMVRRPDAALPQEK